MCPSGALVVERVEQRQRPRGLVEAGEPRKALECGSDARQPAPGQEPRVGVGDLDRLGPHRLVRRQILARDHTVALGHELEQGFRDRAAVDARRALVGDQLERVDEPRLLEPLARTQQSPLG